MERPLLLTFADYRAPVQRLARVAGLRLAEIEVHTFPDGESRVRLPVPLPAHIILCRSLDRPNDKLVHLLLAATTARELGARQITLVAPYLCYMRQDKAFHPGEAVSQRIIGHFLAAHVDALITVDPHLHRVHHLHQAVPTTQGLALSATDLMGAFVARHISRPFLLGPDDESAQWVAAIARQHSCDYAVAHKHRQGDRQVQIMLPDNNYQGRHMILVDDVISTGRTLAGAALALARHQPASISVMVTHALFAEETRTQLTQAGVTNIWSTDSILHRTNCIHLDRLLASALREHLA